MTMIRTIKWTGILGIALALIHFSAFAQANEQESSGAIQQQQSANTQQRSVSKSQGDADTESQGDSSVDEEEIEAQGPTGEDAGFGSGAVGLPEEPVPDDGPNEQGDDS